MGFTSPKVTTISQIWELNSPEDLFTAFYEGAVRTGGILRAQSKTALQKVRKAIIEETSKYASNGKILIPMPAVLSSAQK